MLLRKAVANEKEFLLGKGVSNPVYEITKLLTEWRESKWARLKYIVKTETVHIVTGPVLSNSNRFIIFAVSIAEEREKRRRRRKRMPESIRKSDDIIYTKVAKLIDKPFITVKWDMSPMSIIEKLLEVIENAQEERGEL